MKYSKNPMKLIKVAIYEDNEGLREILAEIIRDEEAFELAGEFGHCLDVLKNTEAFLPNVIIMDIDMPGKTGIEGTREIKAKFPNIEVIINTVFDDDDRIMDAFNAGASGYLLKKSSLIDIVSNIKDVLNGGAPMSSTIARKLLSLNKFSSNKENIFNLTDKESEVLSLLSKGLSYKMVGMELFISIETVRSHIKKMYQKLHVHSITEAIHKVYIDKK
jgi:DNA-binding NarL/FixJ family response regulator